MISLDTVIESAYIYLVECSRGPGSETYTADVHIPILSKLDSLRETMPEEGWEPQEIEVKVAEWRVYLDKPEVENPLIDGIDNVLVPCNDEGPSFLVRKPLTLREILHAIIEIDPEAYLDGVPPLEYRTAMYRALINNWPPNKTFERWSSVNAWRNLKCELMPKWQVEQCMDLFNLTLDQVYTCDCHVLRESAKNPSETYSGC